ncbi:MAG: FAD-dependent oxidoreductase [Clostridiales bacterium]|nr:FAD-dependent oxidoreductase [Clostridiales bacterium]MCF8022817.1 FAD-dependent oxidoreductase [Clostridiales bacterium]
MSNYANLFKPMKIGPVDIKNKIAMAPMGILGLSTPEGGFAQRGIDYYVERAKGGTGLIITSVTKVENEIEQLKMPTFPCITLNPMHFIQTASELTERVHAYGTKIFLQVTLGFGRSGAPQLLDGPPVAPSAIPNYWDPSVTCRELSTSEVETMVKRFGEAAHIAVEAGFDGMEIHAVHEGYLLDQFTLNLFNRRTDKYGGDVVDRLTLPAEIVREIKSKAGKKFPVGLRYSIKSYIKNWGQGGLPGEEFQELGRDLDEGLEAAKILEQAGYDHLNADAGTYDAWYWAHPPLYFEHGCYLPLTEKLKQVVNVPVLVAGRMEYPDLAERALVEGKADMVALGRGLLTEAYWPQKVIKGEVERIRPCIGCHVGCLGRIFEGRPLSCAVNPAAGREIEYGIDTASEKKNVLIAGGGIAGMEAARVAAIRGHNVTLYEKTGELGGHVIAGGAPDFKKDDERLLSWYKNELNILNINIHLNQEVNKDVVNRDRPDAVIVATGSTPVIPDIPGIDKGNVTTATDLLLGKKQAGQSVVIIGGGLVGCETALWLAKQGKQATIVEAMQDLMLGAKPPVPHTNRSMLIDLLKYHQVNLLPNNSLLEIADNNVTVIDKNFNKQTLPADTVAIAVGYKPENSLYSSFAGELADLYAIGDASDARNIMYAIWDAYEVARSI